jgi:HSP20 family molecular chaperone IbpA
MNRLFDDMLSRFDPGMPSLVGRTPGWAGAGWPSVEVNATDNEVRVSAELPGMDEKDIEVLVDNDVLTIRGEKKSETEDKDRRFSERYYGRFERSLALPFEVDEEKAEARSRTACSPSRSRNPRPRRTRRSVSPSMPEATPSTSRMQRSRAGSRACPADRSLEGWSEWISAESFARRFRQPGA